MIGIENATEEIRGLKQRLFQSGVIKGLIQ
jgi:hypothetical protein